MQARTEVMEAGYVCMPNGTRAFLLTVKQTSAEAAFFPFFSHPEYVNERWNGNGKLSFRKFLDCISERAAPDESRQ